MPGPIQKNEVDNPHYDDSDDHHRIAKEGGEQHDVFEGDHIRHDEEATRERCHVCTPTVERLPACERSDLKQVQYQVSQPSGFLTYLE